MQISYDGSDFNGWQIQPQKSTIQGEISAAIKKLTGEDVSLMGSGRTDAGVHAIAQVAHFDLTRRFDIVKIMTGLNFYLPQTIRITAAKHVSDKFNARFSPTSKTYIYIMYIAKTDNPLLQNKALRVEGSLNLAAMQHAARLFEGTHDFTSFMSSGSTVKNTVRTVTSSTVFAATSLVCEDGLLVFKVSANGFLYNMVRKMAAVLLSVGDGKRTCSDVAAALSNPQKIKDIVPPHGLYLERVEYPPELLL